jgi:hypothetical protein
MSAGLTESQQTTDKSLPKVHVNQGLEFGAGFLSEVSGECIVFDGICNSACTLVLGIVPLNRVCVTPRASLGFHMAYFDKSTTAGVKVMSYEGTADVMSYYPNTVKDWLSRHGGLTPDMKKVRNGPELWAIVDPCPEEFF